MQKSYIRIIETETDSIVEEVFYSDLSEQELIGLSGMGHDGAVDEYIKREKAAAKAVVPDLVKARRAMMDHALARLKEMPDDDDGLVDVPWEVMTRPKVDDHHWSDSKLKAVGIEKLFATQRKLKKENIVWHIEHPGETREGKNAFPNIVKNIDGNRLIYDGHHRLAALWLLGSDDALVWYLKEQDL